MSRIKVHYTLVNRKTNSVIHGNTYVEGNSFHEISDGLAKLINAKIPERLRKMDSENPEEWNVLGFSDAKERNARIRRAKEMQDA